MAFPDIALRDNGAGAFDIALAGSSTFDVVPDGGFTLAGAGALSRTLAVVMAGGLALAGAAEIVRAWDREGDGGLVFLGTGSASKTIVPPAPTGGLTFAGTADAGFGAVYTVAGSGGFVLSGTGTVSSLFAAPVSGGISLAGSAAASKTLVAPTAGGFAFSGSATIERLDVFEFDGSGGFVLAGAAILARTLAIDGDGGFGFAGEAETATSTQYDFTADGGFTLLGATTVITGRKAIRTMVPTIFEYLSADTEVLSLLADGPIIRIFRDEAPQDVRQPYVVWSLAAGRPENYVSDRPGIDYARIQFDIYAKTQDDADEIYAAVGEVLETHGHIVSFNASMRDEPTRLYRVSFDYSAWTLRA